MLTFYGIPERLYRPLKFVHRNRKTIRLVIVRHKLREMCNSSAIMTQNNKWQREASDDNFCQIYRKLKSPGRNDLRNCVARAQGRAPLAGAARDDVAHDGKVWTTAYEAVEDTK